jgi:Ceramidase
MATDWTAPIDAYCERVDASFWSEPVNALSNAAFLVAAAIAFARWRRAGAADLPALFLIAAVAVVGIGSFLFHTFANRWSRLADVIPIAVFIYGYFALAMRRFFGLGLAASVGLTLAFLAFSFGFERAWLFAFGPRGIEATNGSVGYFPAALALFAVGLALIARGHGRDLAARRRRAGQALLVAACAFVVSLAFRTVDIAFCDASPVGTHFVWHMLNAVVLFILVGAAMRFGLGRPEPQ